MVHHGAGFLHPKLWERKDPLRAIAATELACEDAAFELALHFCAFLDGHVSSGARSLCAASALARCRVEPLSDVPLL